MEVSSSLICHNMRQSSWEYPNRDSFRKPRLTKRWIHSGREAVGGLSVTEETAFYLEAFPGKSGNQAEHHKSGAASTPENGRIYLVT